MEEIQFNFHFPNYGSCSHCINCRQGQSLHLLDYQLERKFPVALQKNDMASLMLTVTHSGSALFCIGVIPKSLLLRLFLTHSCFYSCYCILFFSPNSTPAYQLELEIIITFQIVYDTALTFFNSSFMYSIFCCSSRLAVFQERWPLNKIKFIFIAMCHLKAITQNKNYNIFYR